MKNPLAHDSTDHEAYGEAMVKCQGYAPACSTAGECALEGWCFGRDGTGFAKARKMVEALMAGQDVFVRGWLRVALEGMDQHQFCGRKTLDALRMITITKRVRREYHDQC